MANSANGDVESSPTQKKDCFFFVQYGVCSYGQNCKYNHPPRDDSPVVQEGRTENVYESYKGDIPCKFFNAGFCMNGTNCEFNHSLPDPMLQCNSDGLPMRMGEPLCSFYMHNRWCGFGADCMFHHPELYFVPQEYGFGGTGQAQEDGSYAGTSQDQEYDDGILGSTDPISATSSPHQP